MISTGCLGRPLQYALEALQDCVDWQRKIHGLAHLAFCWGTISKISPDALLAAKHAVKYAELFASYHQTGMGGSPRGQDTLPPGLLLLLPSHWLTLRARVGAAGDSGV
eukprot:10518612-Alexandrium_andersonii.AAC.1